MDYFSSDFHAFHANISGPSRSAWSSGFRNFKDEYVMTAHLAEMINKTVQEDDNLYFMGDWSFGGPDKVEKFRNLIICKNIHLCLGNHDQHIRRNKPTKVEGVFNKDLFTSVQDTLEVSFGKKVIFMSHYKHHIWNGSHKGYIHLYGHSHASAEHIKIGKSMDVGVDNAYKLLGEYRPFSLEEVLNLMDKRAVHYPDHHDKNTNIK
jgi:calcineurin-like phosphoesterase family protein